MKRFLVIETADRLWCVTNKKFVSHTQGKIREKARFDHSKPFGGKKIRENLFWIICQLCFTFFMLLSRFLFCFHAKFSCTSLCVKSTHIKLPRISLLLYNSNNIQETDLKDCLNKIWFSKMTFVSICISMYNVWNNYKWKIITGEFLSTTTTTTETISYITSREMASERKPMKIW